MTIKITGTAVSIMVVVALAVWLLTSVGIGRLGQFAAAVGREYATAWEGLPEPLRWVLGVVSMLTLLAYVVIATVRVMRGPF
jgi:hypothetical protein